MRSNKPGEPTMNRKTSILSKASHAAAPSKSSLLMRKGTKFNLADVKNRMK